MTFDFDNRTMLTASEATSTAQPSRQITSIVSYSKGFALAFGRGLVYVYERTDEKDMFKKTREIRVSFRFPFSLHSNRFNSRF